MELSKDHQAPATLPGLCYVQTARQPTHLSLKTTEISRLFRRGCWGGGILYPVAAVLGF